MTNLMLNTVKYALLAAGVIFSLLAANLAQAITMPVLKETARAGTIITENMLAYKPYDDRRVPRHALTHPNLIVGKEVVRTVREGRPIIDRSLRTPPHSRKGQIVSMEYRRAGMKLTSEGKLLADAALGDQVRVQNIDTRRILLGTVIADGIVQIN